MKRLHESDIDLNLIRVLVAVLQEKSMTRAAQRLRMTQPAVSFAIRRLRELLGDPLFIKTHNTLVPTQFALELEAPLAEALDAIWRTVSPSVFDPSQMRRHLRIAMSGIGESVLLPPLLRRIRAEAPHVTIEARQTPVEAVEEALRLGTVDIAVGNFAELGAGTRRVTLMSDRYVCMVWRGNPHTGERLTVKDLAGLKHILVASASSSHRAIEDMFVQQDIHRDIVVTVSSFASVADVLRDTDLAVVLPGRIAERCNQDGDFRSLQMPFPLRDFQVTLHWDPRLDNDAANTWLRELVVDVLTREQDERQAAGQA